MSQPTVTEISAPAYPRWQLLAAGTVLGLGLAVLLANWAHIPESLPGRFGSPDPNEGVQKSFWSVTQLIWYGALLVGVLGTSAAIGQVATRNMPVDPARGGVPVPFSASLAGRAGQLSGKLGRCLGWLALVLSIGFSYGAIATAVPGFSAHRTAALAVVLIGTVAGGLTVTVVSITTLEQARKRFPPDAAEQERQVLEQDGSLYKFGIFYVNPADPMSMVHSRSNPDNVDFNYAHLPGKVFATVTTVVVLGVLAAVLWAIA